jgi:hypothetical protein
LTFDESLEDPALFMSEWLFSKWVRDLHRIDLGDLAEPDLIAFRTLAVRVSGSNSSRVSEIYIKLYNAEMRRLADEKTEKMRMRTSWLEAPLSNGNNRGANIFFLPSYTAGGLKIAGATFSCRCLMRSILSLAGRIFSDGEMTAMNVNFDAHHQIVRATYRLRSPSNRCVYNQTGTT